MATSAAVALSPGKLIASSPGLRPQELPPFKKVARGKKQHLHGVALLPPPRPAPALPLLPRDGGSRFVTLPVLKPVSVSQKKQTSKGPLWSEHPSLGKRRGISSSRHGEKSSPLPSLTRPHLARLASVGDSYMRSNCWQGPGCGAGRGGLDATNVHLKGVPAPPAHSARCLPASPARSPGVSRVFFFDSDFWRIGRIASGASPPSLSLFCWVDGDRRRPFRLHGAWTGSQPRPAPCHAPPRLATPRACQWASQMYRPSFSVPVNFYLKEKTSETGIFAHAAFVKMQNFVGLKKINKKKSPT